MVVRKERMWYLWLQCGGINELDIGQGGGDEEAPLLVNPGKNSGEPWTRKIDILWSQEPLCVYLATYPL